MDALSAINNYNVTSAYNNIRSVNSDVSKVNKVQNVKNVDENYDDSSVKNAKGNKDKVVSDDYKYASLNISEPYLYNRSGNIVNKDIVKNEIKNPLSSRIEPGYANMDFQSKSIYMSKASANEIEKTSMNKLSSSGILASNPYEMYNNMNAILNSSSQHFENYINILV